MADCGLCDTRSLPGLPPLRATFWAQRMTTSKELGERLVEKTTTSLNRKGAGGKQKLLPRFGPHPLLAYSFFLLSFSPDPTRDGVPDDGLCFHDYDQEFALRLFYCLEIQ